MHLPFRLRHVVFGALSLAALAAVATTPQLLGHQMHEGIVGLADARAIWLWLAATASAGGLLSLSFAWRSALGPCGGETSRVDAASRYGAGSLAGSLLPAKVNSAVRIVLFSRTIPNEGRLWTSGGVASAIGAAHALWLAILLAYAGASGVLPLWPLAALALAVAAAAGVAVVARSRQPRHKVSHALDVFRVLGSSPRATATLLGWTGLALLARVAGMTAIAMALGVERPFAAALLVVPAVELAGLLPLTPGNIGVTAAAAAFALRAPRAPEEIALAAGVAFNAVEAATSIAFGAAGVLQLATRLPRWAVQTAAACGVAGITGAFSLTVLVPLV